jgi:hypothetical protein
MAKTKRVIVRTAQQALAEVDIELAALSEQLAAPMNTAQRHGVPWVPLVEGWRLNGKET